MRLKIAVAACYLFFAAVLGVWVWQTFWTPYGSMRTDVVSLLAFIAAIAAPTLAERHVKGRKAK